MSSTPKYIDRTFEPHHARTLANSNSHDRPSCRPRCGSTAAAWRMANNCAGMLPRALVFQAQWFSSKVLQLKKYKTCLRYSSKMISSNPLRMFWGVSRLAPSQHLTLARVRTETLAWSKKSHNLRLEIIQSIQNNFRTVGTWNILKAWPSKDPRSEVQEAAPCNRAAPCKREDLLWALENHEQFHWPWTGEHHPKHTSLKQSGPKTNTVSWRMDVHTCLTYYVESHLITSLYSWFILIRDVPSVSSVALDPPRPCSPSSGQRFSAT